VARRFQEGAQAPAVAQGVSLRSGRKEHAKPIES